MKEELSHYKNNIKQFIENYDFKKNDEISISEITREILDIMSNIKVPNFSIKAESTSYDRKNKSFHINVKIKETKLINDNEE